MYEEVKPTRLWHYKDTSVRIRQSAPLFRAMSCGKAVAGTSGTRQPALTSGARRGHPLSTSKNLEHSRENEKIVTKSNGQTKKAVARRFASSTHHATAGVVTACSGVAPSMNVRPSKVSYHRKVHASSHAQTDVASMHAETCKLRHC